MNKIYIGNLSFKLDEHDLEEAFSRFGEIKDVFLVKDKETKRLKGFGFITFDSDEAAEKAVDDMNGKEIGGRALKVSIAKQRRED